MMKKLILLSIFILSSFSAFALGLNDREQIEKDIKREMKLREIKKKISILQEEFKAHHPLIEATKKDTQKSDQQNSNLKVEKTEI